MTKGKNAFKEIILFKQKKKPPLSLPSLFRTQLHLKMPLCVMCEEKSAKADLTWLNNQKAKPYLKFYCTLADLYLYCEK